MSDYNKLRFFSCWALRQARNEILLVPRTLRNLVCVRGCARVVVVCMIGGTSSNSELERVFWEGQARVCSGLQVCKTPNVPKQRGFGRLQDWDQRTSRFRGALSGQSGRFCTSSSSSSHLSRQACPQCCTRSTSQLPTSNVYLCSDARLWLRCEYGMDHSDRSSHAFAAYL